MMNHTAAAVLTGGLLGIALMGSLAFTTPDEPEQEDKARSQPADRLRRRDKPWLTAKGAHASM